MATVSSDLVDVVLIDGGEKPIHVIKQIRELTDCGLAEAKDLARKTPSVVAGGVARSRAEVALAELEKVGAVVELRSSTGETISSLPGDGGESLELLVQKGALTENERLDASK